MRSLRDPTTTTMTTSSHHHPTATKTAVDVTDMEQHDGPPISCPKSDNNCFFNSSIALGLAAFDGRPLPDTSRMTPAGASFISTLQLIKYVMFDGSHLAEHLLVSLHFVCLLHLVHVWQPWVFVLVHIQLLYPNDSDCLLSYFLAFPAIFLPSYHPCCSSPLCRHERVFLRVHHTWPCFTNGCCSLRFRVDSEDLPTRRTGALDE